MTQNLQDGFGIKHAPLWGVTAVTLLGFLSGKSARNGGVNSLTRLVRLGTSLGPLIKLVMQRSPRKN